MKKISELPDSSAATGTELVPVVQSGVTVKMVLSTIKNYLQSFFAPKTTGSSILKGDGSGGFADATSTDVVSLIGSTPVANATNADKLQNVTPSPYILTLLDDPDAATARTTLGTLSLVNIVRITSPGSGTYNKPENVRALLIRAVGGGGGGGNNYNSNNTGAGGGAGGYVEKFISYPSSSYDYTVGAGGAGNGANGGNTTIAGMTAGGGYGASTYTPGNGGAASGGDLNIRGGDGKPGLSVDSITHCGGNGGSSFFGGEGGGARVRLAQSGQFGGGGGGGNSGSAGASGGAGYIEIWEFA
jgi:hypothetical protein